MHNTLKLDMDGLQQQGSTPINQDQKSEAAAGREAGLVW